MELDEYLHMVADRVKLAQVRGDRAEVLRLLRVLVETLASSIQKIEVGGDI